MERPDELDLMEELQAYLRGAMTLSDLRTKLSDSTWDRPDAPQVAHDLERIIDDALDGHATPQELETELRLFASLRVGSR
jgi:hypothetical protein